MSETPRIIDFKPEHIAGDDAWLKVREGNVAYTAVIGEQIIGSAGIVRLWEGVGEAWVGDNWQRSPTWAIWFHRTVKRLLSETVKAMRLWRVQAHVPQTDYQARAWIMRLGFLEESAVFHYLPNGGHAVTYYRIIEENLPCN